MRFGPSGGAPKSSANPRPGHVATPRHGTWDNAIRESRIVTRRYQILTFALLGLFALPARAEGWLPPPEVLEKIDAALEPTFEKDLEARSEAEEPPTNPDPQANQDPNAPPPPEAQPSESGAESEGPAREPRTAGRRRLERLARGYSLSQSIVLKKEPYSITIRVRYSRSVEFDYHLESYILIEGFEVTPGV